MTKMFSYVAIAALLLLPACSGGLDGEYTDDAGIVTYAFKSGGKVEMNSMGITQEMDYKLEDGKVKLGTPGGGTQVASIDKDGCLVGALTGKMCKKKK
jgi:hypothetical protein